MPRRWSSVPHWTHWVTSASPGVRGGRRGVVRELGSVFDFHFELGFHDA